MDDKMQVVETAPKRIWLQISDDAHNADEDFPETASDQITWCADSVMEVEVKYIRADLVEELMKAARMASATLGHAYHTTLTGQLAEYAHDDYQRLDAVIRSMP